MSVLGFLFCETYVCKLKFVRLKSVVEDTKDFESNYNVKIYVNIIESRSMKILHSKI